MRCGAIGGAMRVATPDRIGGRGGRTLGDACGTVPLLDSALAVGWSIGKCFLGCVAPHAKVEASTT